MFREEGKDQPPSAPTEMRHHMLKHCEISILASVRNDKEAHADNCEVLSEVLLDTTTNGDLNDAHQYQSAHRWRSCRPRRSPCSKYDSDVEESADICRQKRRRRDPTLASHGHNEILSPASTRKCPSPSEDTKHKAKGSRSPDNRIRTNWANFPAVYFADASVAAADVITLAPVSRGVCSITRWNSDSPEALAFRAHLRNSWSDTSPGEPKGSKTATPTTLAIDTKSDALLTTRHKAHRPRSLDEELTGDSARHRRRILSTGYYSAGSSDGRPACVENTSMPESKHPPNLLPLNATTADALPAAKGRTPKLSLHALNIQNEENTRSAVPVPRVGTRRLKMPTGMEGPFWEGPHKKRSPAKRASRDMSADRVQNSLGKLILHVPFTSPTNAGEDEESPPSVGFPFAANGKGGSKQSPKSIQRAGTFRVHPRKSCRPTRAPFDDVFDSLSYVTALDALDQRRWAKRVL